MHLNFLWRAVKKGIKGRDCMWRRLDQTVITGMQTSREEEAQLYTVNSQFYHLVSCQYKIAQIEMFQWLNSKILWSFSVLKFLCVLNFKYTKSWELTVRSYLCASFPSACLHAMCVCVCVCESLLCISVVVSSLSDRVILACAASPFSPFFYWLPQKAPTYGKWAPQVV